MEKKIIFLDIDGTLVNDCNILPESAKEAVKRARANGHYVLICTGRSVSQVIGPVKELEVDGKVCSAGGYVEVGGKVLREIHMTKEDVELIVDYMESKGICYCLESSNGVFVSKNAKAYFKESMKERVTQNPERHEEIEAGMKAFMDIMTEGVEMIREDINKVTFLHSDVPFKEIEAFFKDKFEVLPNSVKVASQNGGEVMMPGVHKASGVQVVLDYLKLDRANSFAYGDGLNDMEMIQYVAYGVAMGNACDELKKVAMDVADEVEADGLYKSFEKYGLI